MNWLHKLCSTPQIIINGEDLFNRCNRALLEMSQRSIARKQELQYYTPDINALNQLLIKIQYPNTNQIMQAMKTQDPEAINELYLQYYHWYDNLRKQRTGPDPDWNSYYEVMQMLRKIIEKFDETNGSVVTEQDAIQYAEQFKNQTLLNMQKIVQNIQGAVSRISSWSTPLIVVVPSERYDESGHVTWAEGSDDALIEFGNDINAPNFSYFSQGDDPNRPPVIEDVLDAGDTDFFSDAKVQNDYFSLVRELKNPGSSSKSGKYLKLYTARPSKDRQQYLNATSLPPNLFLTNSYDHAEGLAIDLSGTDGIRDIWKVIINEQYLIQTLDGPIKYYQIVGDGNVPVRSMELISAN